ncbi:SgcJ/EcaC family oxidoreductase [Rhodococcus sp. IEGM1428]|uniref:SgcJ/EcaC family oxidoreductase n=1 Tax=Rhodococcus sp. IEGM1428 TaxID=3392191 RepID=UPI003D0A74AE
MNTSTTSTGDIDVLVSLVAELERAQRTEDVVAFLSLFDDDAVWVTSGGVRLIGKATIAAFTRKVLPGAFADGSVRYDVEHVRFITSDVALTGVSQEYLNADGDALSPPRKGKPSYLWHRQDGRWLIASGQNTTVPIP